MSQFGWASAASTGADAIRSSLAVLQGLGIPYTGAGLNAEETATVAAFIRQMRLAGKTMILVEHDMEMVMEISDHVVVLDGGSRIAQGTPDAVRHNPLVIEAYLGRMSATA